MSIVLRSGPGPAAKCMLRKFTDRAHAATASTYRGLWGSCLHVKRPVTAQNDDLRHAIRIHNPPDKVDSLHHEGPVGRTFPRHSRIDSAAGRSCSPRHSVVRNLHVQSHGQQVSTEDKASYPETVHDKEAPDFPCIQRTGTSDIRIVDYSTERIAINGLSRSSLSRFLEDVKRPKWAACRWIYVNGLDWEVVNRLGDEHNLHRLAIEDVMHPNTPTKVDWYNDHCFIVMTLQRIAKSQQHASGTNMNGISKRTHGPRFLSDMSSLRGKSHDRMPKEWSQFLHRKHKVSVEQVSIFLTSDNTVITIFEHSGQEVFVPILARLESPQTIIRSSNDASMLVQAVSDAIVDLALPIGKEFGEAFHDLELAVLTRPTIAQSKQLYALRSELTLFQDVIAPISSLVRMLRDHYTVSSQLNLDKSSAIQKATARQDVTRDLISPMTRTYLADVQDRIVVLLSSIRTSIRSAENLTSLMFNTITARQNESVRQLTLVSIFFLPLTFLTGYFGMNFDPMPVVNNNSDVLFWYIAIPFIAASMVFMITRAAWSRSNFWMRRRRARAKDQRS